MINKLLAVCAFLLLASVAHAEDLYVGQSSAGSDTGANCANQHSASWFNSSGNWGAGAGKVSAADTVHACGTFTSALIFQGGGSGTGVNRVTLLFESGAKMQRPYGGLINTGGQSHIVIDGGVACGPGTACSTNDTGTGILEDTANGTGLANKQESRAIDVTNSSDVEIKNLIIRNQFVHTGTVADCCMGSDETSINSVYANPLLGNLTIHDSTFHDVGWSVLTTAYANSPVVEVYNIYFWNMNHGVSPFNDSTSVFTYKTHDNHFGAMANWDTATNDYHHDSIHIWSAGGWGAVSLQFWNNLFDGNAGVNNTAYVFGESNPPNQLWYNNTFITWPGVLMNNGQVTSGGTASTWYNNTFIGSTAAGGQCVHVAGGGLIFKNNVITNCNQFFEVTDAVSAGAAIDYNIYANQSAPGGNTRWRWIDGTWTDVFATWKSSCACDAHSIYNAGALSNFSSVGVPSTGYAGILTGVNLTSLGITTLNSDTIGVGRPASGTPNWDIGAYEFSMPPPGAPTSDLSLTNIPFGNVTVSTTTGITTVTLTNNGLATLNYSSIAKGGTDPTKFNLAAGTCVLAGGTVAIAANCTFTVSFSPTAATAYSATVVITSDSATSPNTVTLSGNGASAVTHTNPGPIIIGNLTLPGGTVGLSYPGATLVASGGSPPFSWGASNLPNGLALSAAGVLLGQPTTAGLFTVTFRATDSVGASSSAPLLIVITSAPSECPVVCPTGPQGAPGKTPATMTCTNTRSRPNTFSCTVLTYK